LSRGRKTYTSSQRDILQERKKNLKREQVTNLEFAEANVKRAAADGTIIFSNGYNIECSRQSCLRGKIESGCLPGQGKL
jgi:hypothetical protein